MNPNFPASLAFVWAPDHDSPAQGFHVTDGDRGGGTNGGVIQVVWDNSVNTGIVKGSLQNASVDQLTEVLRAKFWGQTCDLLPDGLDFLMFNGRMMSGRFPWLFQQCLGFIGAADVDGYIGPLSLAKTRSRDPETLIDAISGVHAAYLSTLDSWARFGGGWTARIKAAQSVARAMADAAPIA